MASSPAPAAPDLHINTTTAVHSSLTSLSSSHHHPSPTARSPHSSATTGSPRSTTTGSGSGSSTNQACAACKYQRRKCNPDCPLAPYFPADQQRRFLNAHRLFGVSNILKTLRRLRPELCAEAMGTLIYQAEMRAQDPVGGCYRVILGLERQLDVEVAELNTVLHHLALYRQAATAIPPPSGTADLDVTSSNQPPLLLNADQEVVDALYASHDADAAPILHADQDHGRDQHQQQQLFDYFYYDATACDDASSKPAAAIDINLDGMQQFDFDATATDQKVDPVVPEEQLDGVNHCQTDHESSREYAEMKAAPLVDMFDMRQELQVVDVNTDVNVNGVDVNANIDVNAVAVNADVDVKPVLQDDGAAHNNITAGEAAQLAAESSYCRLGLGFSSF